MKKKLNKKEALKKVDDFFKSNRLDAKDIKKIKRFCMSYNIKLGVYRKRFCKKCFSDLRICKVKISKNYKTVKCEKCGMENRWRLE
jgi:RNase P subunit RPR2